MCQQEASRQIDLIMSSLKSVVLDDVSEGFLKKLTAVAMKFSKCTMESALENLFLGKGPLLQRGNGSKLMKVQPTAISRRKKTNGSRAAQK